MRQIVAYEILSQSKIIKTSVPKCGSGRGRLLEVVVYERFQL